MTTITFLRLVDAENTSGEQAVSALEKARVKRATPPFILYSVIHQTVKMHQAILPVLKREREHISNVSVLQDF